MDIGLLFKGIIVAGAIIVGLSTTWICKMKKDNTIEQIAEEVIKEESGLDIDLSQGS